MIEINNITLRVPGMSGEDAAWVGNKVADTLRVHMPQRYGNQRLEELNIKIELPHGLEKTEVADRVASQLLRQLNWI